ncbi:MAG: hypothetical protein ABSB59_12050 [Streptosporangiaceae bacterium]|jgi:hypothetical protein
MTSEHPAGHEVIAVEVPGGQLAVETFTSGTEPVLAIHGVTMTGARATAELIAEAQS